LAVTYATFLVRFPEFAQAPQTLVEASLADAELMVDRDVYGAKADMAVGFYAAHLVATNPLGEMARLDKKSDRTTYLVHFERVRRSIGTGFRVI